VSGDLQPIWVVECRIRERFAAEDAADAPWIDPDAHSCFLRNLDDVSHGSPVEAKIVLTECVDDNIEAFLAKSPDIGPDVSEYSIPKIACRDLHD
jgi:uncharacterized Fe-S cluster protein YjdI